MWSAVHHMDRDARGRTKSVIDLMEMDKIMRELPSDMRFLKKLVARLLCTNLEMSIRCKDTLKRLTSANVIMTARLGNPKDIIERVQESIDRGKKLNVLHTLVKPEDRDDTGAESAAQKTSGSIKDMSQRQAKMSAKTLDVEDRPESAPENPKKNESYSKSQGFVFRKKPSLPSTGVRENIASRRPSKEDQNKSPDEKTSIHEVTIDTQDGSKKEDSEPTEKQPRIPNAEQQKKHTVKKKSGSANSKRPALQALQSPTIAINKEGEFNFGFDDPVCNPRIAGSELTLSKKSFEYKAILGEGLILVSYIFGVPHANPVPDEVFKFYCTTSKTYLRKNQLHDIKDGTLFLRRSNYREEDDDDDANEKNKMVIFEKIQSSNIPYIKGITREKLIQRLLRPMMDSYYDYVIILMHTTFMESTAFLKNFANRIKMVTDYGPLSEDRKAFNKLCRLRVVRILSKWIQHFWIDFVNNEDLLSDLKNFVGNVLQPADKRMKTALIALVKKKEGAPENSRTEDSDDDQQEEEVELDKIKSSNLSKTKSEAVRGAVKSVGVLNFPFSLTRKIREQSLNVKFHNASENTEEALTGFMNRLAALTPDSIARQMTLTESYLIKNIQELLNLAWTKESKAENSFNILELTKWSNHIIHLFTTDIVASKDNIRARVESFEKAVLVAECLEKLHNYNGLVEIMAALMSASVYRLKKTREMLEPRISYKFEELKSIVSGRLNYKKLREAIANSTLPFLPFPGLIQSDLVFTDAFNKQYLDDKNKLINLRYIEQYSSSVFIILVSQTSIYDITPNAEVEAVLRDYPTLDNDKTYEMSLHCESKVK